MYLLSIEINLEIDEKKSMKEYLDIYYYNNNILLEILDGMRAVIFCKEICDVE